MTQQISIIGCGWLGLPLAKQLITNGYTVKGSTTSVEKLDLLKTFGINPYLITISEQGIDGNIVNCLNQSDIVIINIPPRLRNNAKVNFVKRIQNLIPYLEASTVSKVLFVSSTSVYADAKSIPIITEKSPTQPETESGKQLLAVEALLMQSQQFETTIIRFGGLISSDRHPANSLSGKTQLKNPKAPVNLIHQKDAINSLIHIIKKKVWNTIFNAVSPLHPNRKDYYTDQCKLRNLALPEFEDSGISKGKIIDSSKLVQLLDFTFKMGL